MRYYRAKVKEAEEEFAYRTYVTDAAKLLLENTANFAGGNTLTARYRDLIMRQEETVEEDPRECKEIVHDLWMRIRGER